MIILSRPFYAIFKPQICWTKVTSAVIYFRFMAYRVNDVFISYISVSIRYIMFYTIFEIISYCTVQFHLHVLGSVAEIYRLHMFHRIESHWVIKAISETRGNAEHSHQSNHETNLTISLSDFHSLALCTAHDDRPPDKSAPDRSMSRGEYVFWLQRVERVMNKYNMVFKRFACAAMIMIIIKKKEKNSTKWSMRDKVTAIMV